MIQRCLASFTRGFSAIFAGKLDNQYFVGSDGFLRPFDQKPFFRTWFAELLIPMSRSHTDSGKTGAQNSLTALAPADVLPSRSAADPALIAELKAVDGQGRGVAVWEVLHGPVFEAARAGVVARVPRLWRWTQCRLYIAARVG